MPFDSLDGHKAKVERLEDPYAQWPLRDDSSVATMYELDTDRTQLSDRDMRLCTESEEGSHPVENLHNNETIPNDPSTEAGSSSARNRWLHLILYSTASFINCMLSFSYSPLPGASDIICGFKGSSIYMVQIYLTSYVLSSLVASCVVEVVGIGPSIRGACWMQSIGALLRCVTGCSNKVYLLGQALAGVSQGFFINTPSEMTMVWFPVDQRLFATNVAVNINTLGISGAYMLVLMLVTLTSHKHNDVEVTQQSLLITAFMALSISIINSFAFENGPSSSPSKAADIAAQRRIRTRTALLMTNAPVSSYGYDTPFLSQTTTGITRQKSAMRSKERIQAYAHDCWMRFYLVMTVCKEVMINIAIAIVDLTWPSEARVDLYLQNALKAEVMSMEDEGHSPLQCSPYHSSPDMAFFSLEVDDLEISSELTLSPLVDKELQTESLYQTSLRRGMTGIGTLTTTDVTNFRGRWQTGTTTRTPPRESVLSRHIPPWAYALLKMDTVWATLQKTRFSYIAVCICFSASETLVNQFSSDANSILVSRGFTTRSGLIFGCLFVVMSLIGSALFGVVVAQRNMTKAIAGMTIMTIICCFSLYFLDIYKLADGIEPTTYKYAIGVVILTIGFFVGPIQGFCVDLGAEVSFPFLNENFSSTVLQMTGNLISSVAMGYISPYASTVVFGFSLGVLITFCFIPFILTKHPLRRLRLEYGLAIFNQRSQSFIRPEEPLLSTT